MKKISESEMAKKAGSSRQMLSAIKRGKSKTTMIPLAVAAAKLYGGKPIDYINDRMRSLALQVNPRLLNKEFKARVPEKGRIVKH